MGTMTKTMVTMRRSSSSNALFDLPPDLFTNVLTSFCSGKTISTFLLASQASKNFDAFDTVQGALVQRYQELATTTNDPNITEMLEILIQQLITCERSSPECMKLFSERCAILDYFEAHGNHRHWLIWCGHVETFYGQVQAYMTSPYWSISAMSSWYRDLELSEFSLVRPRVAIDRPSSYPFGTMAGRTRRDVLVMDRLRIKLDGGHYQHDDYWRGMLTALHFCYDSSPPLVLSSHEYPMLEGHDQVHIPSWQSKSASLSCYWDDFEGYHDEELQNLGEHMIRLMERFSDDSGNFQGTWSAAVTDSTNPVSEYMPEEDHDDSESEEDV